MEKAVIVGLINQSQDVNQTKEYLDELAFSFNVWGNVIERFFQRLNSHFQILLLVKENSMRLKILLRIIILTCIFDDDLCYTTSK